MIAFVAQVGHVAPVKVMTFDDVEYATVPVICGAVVII
jgi:hypothetical protein